MRPNASIITALIAAGSCTREAIKRPMTTTEIAIHAFTAPKEAPATPASAPTSIAATKTIGAIRTRLAGIASADQMPAPSMAST